MKVGFLSNKLTLRGTEVVLYDYAHFNEVILGNQSVILTRPIEEVQRVSPRDVSPLAYQKFSKRFEISYYMRPEDIPGIVEREKIDVLFIEKAGTREDGLTFTCCPTIIHCVFTSKDPHGTLYTAISDFINKDGKTNIPVLPYLCRVHPTMSNMRAELGIPQDAHVFGTFSGADEFTVEYVREVVERLSVDSEHTNTYFLFMNVDKFGPESPRLKFLPGSADMETKKKFINTCDAMLYGRKVGETFGLACAEFSLAGKPVIGRKGEKGDFHETTLGDAFIGHTNFQECYDIVSQWPAALTPRVKEGLRRNGYLAYTATNVMKIFSEALKKVVGVPESQLPTVPSNPVPLQPTRHNTKMEFWKKMGMNPKIIYDIGANSGSWSKEMKALFPSAQFELFEANEKYKENCSHICLLGKEEKMTPFYTILRGFDTGNSMYLELSDAFGKSNYAVELKQARRLDSIVKQKSLEKPDLLKVSVQGAELDVLEGAGDLLDSTKFCILRTALHRWNKGAPMFEDVLSYMTGKGFVLLDILEEQTIKGYLAQVELLFAQKNLGLRRENFYNA